jgi:hypothetical protein
MMKNYYRMASEVDRSVGTIIKHLTQLFDMKNNPSELNDLFNSTNPAHQQKLKEMRKRFVELKMKIIL